MVKFEEKFFVLNYKRFEELNDNTKTYQCGCRESFCEHMPIFPKDCKEIENLKKSLNKFIKAYEKRVGKQLNQQYYVCNRDEEYAEKVKKLIMNGEEQKLIKE